MRKNIVFVQPRNNKNETVYRVIIKYNDENNDYKVKETTYRPLNKSASTKTKENEAYNYGLKVLEDTLAEIERKKQINTGLAFKDIAYRWLDSKFDKNNPLSDRNCSFRYYEICKKAIIFLANYFGDIIIKDITRLNINDCFKAIDNITREVRYAYPKKDFVQIMNSHGYSNSILRRNLKFSSKQVYNAFYGIPIDEEKGHIIVDSCKINYDDLFVTKIEKIDMGDNTKARYKKTLRAIMNYAHNTLGVISDNPMAGNKIIMKKPKEKKAISDEGLLLMFEKCNDFEPRVKLAIRIALTTGMRPEELGGLEWKDIDLNTGKISIKRAVVYVKGFSNVIKETKTGNDRDSVDVQFLLDNIKEYQKWQTELISKLGDCYIDDDKVFFTDSFKRCNAQNFNHWFKKVRNSCSLGKEYSMYSLRHSYISLLLRMGVALQAVAKLAGHASISTTLKYYTHATSEDIKKAGETLNDMFLPVVNKDNKSKTELDIEEYKRRYEKERFY